MRAIRLLLISFFFLTVGCEESEQTSSQPKVYTIGMLSGIDVFNPVIDGFKDRMAEIGYKESETVRYRIERARGDAEKMTAIAKSFVDQRVDLIITTTNQAAIEAKQATAGTDIPVIFTVVMAPVDSGIVDSLTDPSGNVTGVRNPLDEFIGKRLEFLNQLAPEAKNLLILHDPDYPTAKYALRGVRNAAEKIDVTLAEIPVKTSADVAAYLSSKDALSHDAIIIMPDITVQNSQSLKDIFAFAKENRVPVVANTPGQVEKGALFSYLADSYDAGRAAAQLANRALDHKKEGRGHPVISAEPRLVLNLGIAQTLNLLVDDSLLSLSHRIVE